MDETYERLSAKRDTLEEQLIHHKRMVDRIEAERQAVHDEILRHITHQAA